MLYQIIIGPIETIIEWIFNFIVLRIPQVGIFGAILGVSLTINFLALPLYNVADSIQDSERLLNQKMAPQLKRIKETFKGDERFMMIQTYYRECNYNPIYTFKSSLSILIEIPFFIAAYHYLSNCDYLAGKSFLIFNNLAKPDTFMIGAVKIHILPVIMTVINLVSAYFYTRGDGVSMRERVQTAVLPLLFLVLLYNSPSGLVIYWILNNLFSLFKNIFLKLKDPKKYSYIFIASIIDIACIYLCIRCFGFKKKIFFALILCFVDIFPLIYKELKKYFSKKIISFSDKDGLIMTVLLGVSLCLFEGGILSSMVIASSPSEFSYLGNTASPLSYIYSNLFIFSGFFIFWPVCFYFLFKKIRNIFPCLLLILLIVVILNSFIFKGDYGTVTKTFSIQNKESIEKVRRLYKLLPYFITFVVILIVLRTVKYPVFTTVIKNACYIFIFSALIFSYSKVHNIYKVYNKLEKSENFNNNKITNQQTEYYSPEVIEPIIHLSKTGKNVVVLFLDRGQGEFFPSVIKALPEMENQFTGFVYYPNTVGYSIYTLWAAPAVLGGYEYSPDASNNRPEISLKEKHNEALLIPPLLFSKAGYSVTIVDPPCPDYVYKGGNHIYNSIPNTTTYELYKRYSNKYVKEVAVNVGVNNIDKIIHREITNFVIMESLFPNLRNIFYKYCRDESSFQVYPDDFINTFSSLYYLNELTDFDSTSNNYVFLDNEVTHSPVFLDNTFESPATKRTYSSSYNSIDDDVQKHFQVNCAAYKAIGKWIDCLKKNDCYNNTRIIIVGDHGGVFNANSFSLLRNVSPYFATALNPILLFKDFDETGEIKVDNQFMVNADTLYLSMKDLDIDRVNPFTNKPFIQDKKNGISMHIPTAESWNEYQLRKCNTFPLPEDLSLFVKDNIFDNKAWMKPETH